MNILSIEGISKKEKNLNLIDDLNLKLEKGKSIGIKCGQEIALLLINIILGKVLPPKGHVFIENRTNHEYIKKHKSSIAVIFREEGFYQRLSVHDYLLFFSRVYDCKLNLKEIMIRFALIDIYKNKISTLSHSEKKRLSFARALISNPKILLIQEPTLNLDRESTLIIRESIPYMNSLGISIIAFSVSLEEILLLEGDPYTLDERGFKPIESDFGDEKSNLEAVESNSEGEKSNLEFIENKLEGDESNLEDENQELSKTIEKEERESPSFKIDKIPAKINEKIILFNPMEINYIETLDGVTYINVGSEKFPCSLTLTKLEERLKYFGFFRCHRSYLVNLQMVREVITWTRNSYSLILDNKDKSSIPLSKGRMDELKQILNL